MNALLSGLILMVVVMAAQFGITNGCKGCNVKGVCYSANEQWLDKCSTKKCSVDSNGYETKWATSIVKTQCEDTNGKCVDEGQKNSDGCTCKVFGTRWEYSCYGK